MQTSATQSLSAAPAATVKLDHGQKSCLPLMIDSVSIRRAEVDDYDLLTEVYLLSMAGSAAFRDWSSIFAQANVFTYLAEVNEPFAFITAGTCQEEYFRDKKYGELIGVHVLPSHQCHGFGRKLLIHGISVLKRRQYETAVAWIPHNNPGALGIFESVGFRKNGASRELNFDAATVSECCLEIDIQKFF